MDQTELVLFILVPNFNRYGSVLSKFKKKNPLMLTSNASDTERV